MKNLKIVLIIFLGSVLLSSCGWLNRSSFKCKSPGANVEVKFNLNQEGRPYYQVFYGKDLMMDTSYLGFNLNDVPDLVSNFEVIKSEKTSFDEEWEQPWGEQRLIRNNYNQLQVFLQEKSDSKRQLNITFRVFDDGIGFRYEFPEQENLRKIENLN